LRATRAIRRRLQPRTRPPPDCSGLAFPLRHPRLLTPMGFTPFIGGWRVSSASRSASRALPNAAPQVHCAAKLAGRPRPETDNRTWDRTTACQTQLWQKR
jgi:hypothetical protein